MRNKHYLAIIGLCVGSIVASQSLAMDEVKKETGEQSTMGLCQQENPVSEERSFNLDGLFETRELAPWACEIIDMIYNKPAFKATNEIDAQGRLIYDETINGKSTGNRYYSVVNENGHPIDMVKIQ